jgi:hypothetical protein
MPAPCSLVSIVAAVTALGCGSDEAPFGGPYGGHTRHLGPTDGRYSNVDAAFYPPAPPPTGDIQGEPNTWTHIYYAYLREGTIGNCSQAGCHIEMSDPFASFLWLKEHGYLGGADPLLVNEGASCLSWYGGNMPPGPPVQDAAVTAEMNAWAAAGALNN